MQVRLLLGPAGSGKTYRCLKEIRQALKSSAEGSPLLLVAPRQMTYQLERQLLDDPALPGYTRLQILSFERLANFVFERLGKSVPRILDEEGRLMVLRSLLARNRDQLELFRASARLSGFAQQLSFALSELQANQVTPEVLNALAAQMQANASSKLQAPSSLLRQGYGGQAKEAPSSNLSNSLSSKLQDLATLLQDYLDWLGAHDLRDADSLPGEAAEAIKQSPKSKVQSPKSPAEGRESRWEGSLRFGGLWVDGFAELSGQELDLLSALMPHCGEAMLTFCLEKLPSQKLSWLSSWSIPAKTFEQCKKRLEALPEANVSVQVLEREEASTRFAKNPVLAHLERSWAEPKAFESVVDKVKDKVRGEGACSTSEALQVAICANPEAESVLAAREILRHVRAGGRYREITVLARTLPA